MKSISIYTITRNQNIEQLQKLERQLSGRDYFLKMREWELESMKALTAELETCMEDVYALRFFYSFQIPRLGKEFDLLQIKEDQIVNIELKSGVVSDEAIRRQLLQNRYYLSVLGRTIHSYTYISSQNRLVRLTNHDHIAEADWDELSRALKRESPDYNGNIEELFRAELYLISPLREPAASFDNSIAVFVQFEPVPAITGILPFVRSTVNFTHSMCSRSVIVAASPEVPQITMLSVPFSQ